MPKEWTEEERRAHGEKIAATKRRNAELRAQQQAQRYELVEPYYSRALTPQPPPDPPDPPEPEPEPDPQKVLRWRDLARNLNVRKAAVNVAAKLSDDAPVVKARCNNCRQEMYTRDPQREDICETCEFQLIDDMHRQRQQHERQRGGVMVDPFHSQGNPSRVINPFGGGGRLF